jgi:hypothetical protein
MPTSDAERRETSTSRLEIWGVVLALGVLGAFGLTFGLTLVPHPAPSDVADDGPGDPRGRYQAKQAVQAWHAGSWYPAHVHSVSGERYFITYDDFSISWHEWVTARRLRRR